MFHRLRQVVPAWFLIALALLGVAAFVLPRLPVSDPDWVRSCRHFGWMGLGLLGFGLGLWRVVGFHPVCRREYAEWLATTPWTHLRPLPLGPVHLVWEDLVYLVPASLAAWYWIGPYALIFLCAFAGGYLLAAALAISNTEQSAIVPVMVAVLPLMAYPFPSIWSVAGVVVVLYLLACLALMRFLRGFPWNTSLWVVDPVAELRREAAGVVSPSLQVFGPARRRPGKRMFWLWGCLLVTWCFHAVIGGVEVGIPLMMSDIYSGPPVKGLPWGDSYLAAAWIAIWPLWRMLCFVLIVSRPLIYVVNALPPISLLGRLATGRVVIPSYDHVLLPPVGVAVVGLIMPQWLMRVGVSPNWAFTTALLLMLLIDTLSPPDLQTWRLTGPRRVTLVRLSLTTANQTASRRGASRQDSRQRPIRLSLKRPT